VEGEAGAPASRWPWWLRLTGASTALALAVGGLAISVAVHRAAPDEPGRFYAASVPSSLLLGLTFLSNPPWESEPWNTILAQNTPGATPTRVPMLVTQGDADPIVAPDVTAQFVSELCANGETVDYRVLPGVAHLEAGHVAAPDVAAWFADRFAGEPAPNTCSPSDDAE
jgi:hypothetical protein